MNSTQISMPFLSPEVASHTFPEFMGAWNSQYWHEGQIITADGRTLVVQIKLKDSHGIIAMVNGEEFEIKRPIHLDWHFKGDSLAQVVSAEAIGQKPALFKFHEEQSAARKRESDRRHRIENKKILREVHKRLKEESQ